MTADMISRRRIIGSQLIEAPFESCQTNGQVSQDQQARARDFRERRLEHSPAAAAAASIHSQLMKFQNRFKPETGDNDEPEEEQDYGEIIDSCSDIVELPASRGPQNDIFRGRKLCCEQANAPRRIADQSNKLCDYNSRLNADEMMALTTTSDLNDSRGDDEQDVTYNRHFDPYSVYGEDDDEEDIWYSEQRLLEVSLVF